MPDFELLESLLWEPADGFYLLPLHLRRLLGSAEYFGFAASAPAIQAALVATAKHFDPRPRKVRMLLDAAGGLRVSDEDVKPSSPVPVCLAQQPIDSRDVFLRHKTTHRPMYDRELAARAATADDVILWNERGELTETCSANLVLDLNGKRLTPERSCGLLPGTLREHLLHTGEIQEAKLLVTHLQHAEAVWQINSVRKWCALQLV